MKDIRHKAEELLQQQEDITPPIPLENTIQELRIHQIELELQNDELRDTQYRLEQTKQRYEELYNFAPVGYFTFDIEGSIVEINWNAAKQVGLEKQYLLRMPFLSFLAPQSQNIFILHLKWVFELKKPQRCELIIKKADGKTFYAQMDSIGFVDEHSEITQCHSSLIDINEKK